MAEQPEKESEVMQLFQMFQNLEKMFITNQQKQLEYQKMRINGMEGFG